MQSFIDFKFRFVSLLLVTTILGACATGRDRIVLLPNKDGTPSALILKTSKGEKILDKPYAAASVSGSGAIDPAEQNAETVKTNYGNVLAAQPERPISYMLYFISGTDELTPQSKIMLEQVKAELKARAAPEITAIGHTDTVGKGADNDTLSRERATTMRNILVAYGVSGDHFTVAGRGERELLIQTADGADEPKNRRVEINVR
jgi:outer membrane protein OmpA-like peptidoglycan-associated protein